MVINNILQGFYGSVIKIWGCGEKPLWLLWINQIRIVSAILVIILYKFVYNCVIERPTMMLLCVKSSNFHLKVNIQINTYKVLVLKTHLKEYHTYFLLTLLSKYQSYKEIKVVEVISKGLTKLDAWLKLQPLEEEEENDKYLPLEARRKVE